MRVTNWYKWTRTKKRYALASMCIGLLLGLSIENNSLWFGVVGIIFCASSAYTITTIHDNEW